MHYAGIDLHKRDLVVAVEKSRGKAIKPISFNCRDTIKIVSFFKKIRPFMAVIEATSSYRWLYDTSAYVSEGFIAAWTYIDDPQFRKQLEERVKKHVDFLIWTQNDDGSWAKKGGLDQLRSHGLVNLLLWYYYNVDKEPAIARAIR